MNNELLLLTKKHTDTLIEQTKTKPQETPEIKMNKQMQTFSFSSPINLVEEGKWLLGVSLFEYINCFQHNQRKQFVFNHYTRSLPKQI